MSNQEINNEEVGDYQSRDLYLQSISQQLDSRQEKFAKLLNIFKDQLEISFKTIIVDEMEKSKDVKFNSYTVLDDWLAKSINGLLGFRLVDKFGIAELLPTDNDTLVSAFQRDIRQCVSEKDHRDCVSIRVSIHVRKTINIEDLIGKSLSPNELCCIYQCLNDLEEKFGDTGTRHQFGCLQSNELQNNHSFSRVLMLNETDCSDGNSLIQHFKKMRSLHDLIGGNRSNLVNGIGSSVKDLIEIMEMISFDHKFECLDLLHKLNYGQSSENIDSFLDDLLVST